MKQKREGIMENKTSREIFQRIGTGSRVEVLLAGAWQEATSPCWCAATIVQVELGQVATAKVVYDARGRARTHRQYPRGRRHATITENDEVRLIPEDPDDTNSGFRWVYRCGDLIKTDCGQPFYRWQVDVSLLLKPSYRDIN